MLDSTIEATCQNRDYEQLLLLYIEEQEKAKALLLDKLGIRLEGIDIQMALCERLGLGNDSVLLLEKELNHGQMVVLLEDYPFKNVGAEVIAEFEEDLPLIPDSVPRVLTEQTIKVRGEVWRVHKSDVDPFPSIPHAHNLETGVVLHLGSGEMFDTNRMSLGSIGHKSLTRIRGILKEKKVTLPPFA